MAREQNNMDLRKYSTRAGRTMNNHFRARACLVLSTVVVAREYSVSNENDGTSSHSKMPAEMQKPNTS